MNTSNVNTKVLFILVITFIVASFVACRKEIKPEEEPQANVINLNDSCSYTIDGKQFTCDNLVSFGRGNSGANLDIATGEYDPDTSLYFTSYALMNKEGGGGYLDISFIKKYGKNQLTKTWFGGILGPATDLELYKKGEHNYAVEYERSNSQNGIAFAVINTTNTSSERLITYINASAFWSTTIPSDCQNDSKFEIVKLFPLADGSHIMEAIFTATVFDAKEKAKKLENGYLRLNVN